MVEEPPALVVPDVLDAPLDGEGHLGAEPPAKPADSDERTVRAPLVVLAGALAASSAAWMVTRLFRGGVLPLVVALVGVAIGSGAIFLAHRLGRSSIIQYLAMPVAAAAGAGFAVTAAATGDSLPRLVLDAVRGGGLSNPPIPFDPGWRFLLLVLFAIVAAGACSLGVSLARPKLALALPLPVALGASLLQPSGSELLASAVAIVLLVAALAVAYGAELANDGVSGGSFEVRRLVRGATLLLVVVAVLFGVAQTDFLFPDTNKDEVIPPMKPPTPPPEPDRELFQVRSDQKGPWRVGVLDVYQDNAFLLPSVDPKRVTKVPSTGVLVPPTGPTYTATFHIKSVRGQTLIVPANATAVKGVGQKMTYDPRTQLARLVETSLPREFEYTVEAPISAESSVLNSAPDPNPAIASEFTAMPPAPPKVLELLARADEATKTRFDRLQLVRQALYKSVVAAGGGTPVDVPPARVDELLAGGEASPYEITAAEVMLARWAGIPARIGFGFYGGDPIDGGTSFRPRHGAAWLEAYFEGAGWIPIVGTPPKAKPSLSNDQKKQDPTVVPTDELALAVIVPVRLQNVRLIYEVIRYYASLGVPIVLALVLLLIGYPGLFKVARTRKRRAWAAERGPVPRVVVAYAELRDRLYDLNIGDPRHSPLELLADVEPDDEHAELAWLVTRGLWGDLRRDLRLEDVEAAERMARSVQRRVDRAQSGLNRALAWSSRVSLRDPWSDEIPNTWRARTPRTKVQRGATGRGRLRLRLPRLPRRRLAAVASAIVAVVMLGGCVPGPQLAESPIRFPDPMVPPTVLGFPLERQATVEAQYAKPGDAGLVSEGRVYTIRKGASIQGSVQISLLKPDVDGRSWKVQSSVERGLGSEEGFRTIHAGTVRLRTIDLSEQRIYAWFPPELNVMELFIMRKGFEEAEQVVLELIKYQRSAPPGSPGPADAVPPPTSSTTLAPTAPGGTT
jgi:transglutaminase-like putative cysteine protease